MAATSVTVLCPAGRRVNVKVTPNTSILQIIEEASQKQGLDPDQYDLKHLRRILDSGSSVRHAGLPNRCQLEMVEAAAPRSPTLVTVHVVTESGLRLVQDFPCTKTLWDILVHHKEHSGLGDDFLPPIGSQQEVVLVYAMRRITCPELTKVTLRTLGITSGKCMLRHNIQNMAGDDQQAHVSAPLTRRTHPPHGKEESEMKPEVPPEMKFSPKVQSYTLTQERAPGFPASLAPWKQSCHLQDTNAPTMEDALEVPRYDVTSHESELPHAQLNHSSEADKELGADCPAPLDLSVSHHLPEVPPPPKIIKIGHHDAIVFSMADAPPTLTGNEDDAFFQLTAEEVRRLHKEQRKAISEMIEAPLMTKSMREMEETSRVLTALNRYPVTHLRIHFPDEHVVQASFKPTNTVADVISFLRPFLAHPSADFSLYTRHPPRTLPPDITLVAADCVPNARLYYSTAAGMESPPYLSEDTLAKKSSYSGACSSLGKMQSKSVKPLGVSNNSSSPHQGPSSSATSSMMEETPDVRPHTSARAGGAVPKVPKWFKLGK